MQGFNVAGRASPKNRLLKAGLLAVAVGILALGASPESARADDGAASLGLLGEKALEKLPWEVHVLRANLSKNAPVAIEGCYLMSKQLLLVTASGKVYCLDRRNLEPRWVNVLRYPLAQAPAEGANDYVFLMKDARGSFWVTAISKRSGSFGARFPVRLPFAASSGIDANGAMMFVGSLGRPGNNRTLETVNLVSGRSGWGYRSTGMLFGSPTLDPDGDIVILAGDDGVVTALAADASAPENENWMRNLGGGIRGSVAVTPAHVVVGTGDGVLYNLDLFSGRVNWMMGVDEPIRETPWVFGGYVTKQKSSGVEGASSIDVRSYEGIVLARNVNGTHCYDLSTGKHLFTCKMGERPVCRHGNYLLMANADRNITVRDASKGYEPVGTLHLGMFDLIPSNRSNGEFFGVTADGSVVVAVPK